MAGKFLLLGTGGKGVPSGSLVTEDNFSIMTEAGEYLVIE